jgi:hypothetical protein
MSDTQQKIVRLSDFVAAVIPEPHFLTQAVAVNIRSGLQHVSSDIHGTAKLDEVARELPGRFCTAVGVDRSELNLMSLKLVGLSETDRTVKVLSADGFSEPPQQMHSTAQPGIDWFGEGEIATRIIKGNSGISVEGVEAGPQIEFFIPTSVMSITDAVDVAQTLVETTATVAKFVQAVIRPNQDAQPFRIDVGGAVHAAVVRSSGFSWVLRPPWLEESPRLGPSGPSLPD